MWWQCYACVFCGDKAVSKVDIATVSVSPVESTMFFWLFPIPYYEVWIKDFIRWIAKDNTLFLPLGEMQKGITYQVKLQKDFMLLSDGLYIPKFPWYVLIWFVATLIAFFCDIVSFTAQIP